jgi:hypothetical protein
MTSTTNECLSFGEALKHAIDYGDKIARVGWNGPDMWVCYMPPITIPAEQVNTRTRRFLAEGPLYVGGYFVMWTAQQIWQPGWLASQADMAAEDWYTL